MPPSGTNAIRWSEYSRSLFPRIREVASIEGMLFEEDIWFCWFF